MTKEEISNQVKVSKDSLDEEFEKLLRSVKSDLSEVKSKTLKKI